MVTHASPPNAVWDDAPAADACAAIWRVLGGVVDPEILVVSIVELGIVRSVERREDGWTIALAPTYSGCPALRVIEDEVRRAVATVSPAPARIEMSLSPPWTTDWIAPEARHKLHAAGIAPPAGGTRESEPRPIAFRRAPVRCPNCGSLRTEEIARFGSTACKAQYRCTDCLEPFDYFKPH
jgi:ring-1,2-phenylacetyl-CoA epoxidase subunit PaaD